jgi:iron complex transport system ATP-binding protein
MSVNVQNLTYRFRNFSLHVEHIQFENAQLTAIVGPNGAGKTTFLKCLSAILPVSKGSLFINGRDLGTLREDERAKLLAYVPQEHTAVFNYAVLDFVLMGRAAYLPMFSTPSAGDVKIAQEALDFVALGHYASRPYFQLSSGERRLVLIARALAQKSDILILDEPTSFLDPKHETEILDLAKKLASEKQKTVLVTLHNLDMAVKYSDAMVFMKQGRVVASGKPDDILDEALLENVYEIKMKIIGYDGRKFIVK